MEKRRSWGRGSKYPLESYSKGSSPSWVSEDYTEAEKQRIDKWKKKIDAVNSGAHDKSESNKQIIEMWNKYKTSKLSSGHSKECGVCGIGVDADGYCKSEACPHSRSDNLTLKHTHSLKVEEKKFGQRPKRSCSPPRHGCMCRSCMSTPHHGGCGCSSCGMHSHNKHDHDYHVHERDHEHRYGRGNERPRQWRHSWGKPSSLARGESESPWKRM